MLLHLNKFNRLDCAAYSTFKDYFKVKFKLNFKAIGAEIKKVQYTYSYLTGKAAKRIYFWLAFKEERQKPLQVKDFFSQLDAAFSDLQSAQRALEWINTKRQGS